MKKKESEKQNFNVFCTNLPENDLSRDKNHKSENSPFFEVSRDNDWIRKRDATTTRKAYRGNKKLSFVVYRHGNYLHLKG